MRTLFVTLCICAVAGCATSHRYSVNRPIQKNFGAFRIVEVLPFSTNVDSEAANRAASELPQALIGRLREATREGSNDKLFSAVGESAQEREGVLTIGGTILSYEEGSRAKRYLIGLGAGKAYATVECIFTDKATGREITVATFDGELSGGFFGGAADQATKGVIRAIEDFIKDNY